MAKSSRLNNYKALTRRKSNAAAGEEGRPECESWERDSGRIADLAEFRRAFGMDASTCYGGGMGALWWRYGGAGADQLDSGDGLTAAEKAGV
jgi:hypothetical protein